MSISDFQKSVRCKKCRTNLFLLKDHPLVDCHGLSVERHTNEDNLFLNKDTAHTGLSNQDYICDTQRDNSMIFLKEESYPPFIEDAVNEAAWQKGKLCCPKCRARLGSFNFVNIPHCSCQLSLLPAVHLQISKVDCLFPWEKIHHHISLPPSENCEATVEKSSLNSADLSNDRPTSLENMARLATTQFNYLNEERLPEGSLPEECITEAQVRDIKSSNADQCLVQCIPKYIDSLKLLKNVSSTKGEFDQVSFIQRSSLEDKIELHIGESQLRKRKIRSKSFLSEPSSIPSLANSDLSNNDGDKEEAQSLKDCKSSEDFSQSSKLLMVDSTSEGERNNEEEEGHAGDKLLTTKIPDNLICPVCLDMLYSPFMVKPCSHIFCEPCLRRLARRAPTNTSCPLCRELIGICNPCHDISKDIKEKYPEQLQERHKFEKLHESQHLPLPWIRDYRFRARRGHGQYGRNWTGWKTILWIFVLDCLGLALVLIIKWILGDYEANLQQQLDFQSKQRTLDTPSNLELESSYPKSQKIFDIHNDSIFSSILE